MTGLLNLNSCASFIHVSQNVPDSQWCHPFLNAQGQEIGASCDNFLTSNPKTLSASDWAALQASWGVTECTTSNMMLAAKKFVEDTCSEITCDDVTKAAFLERFARIGALGTSPGDSILLQQE